MKSLKRTLCLVLALVMVLGLFGIASATNFTDDNQVQYKEAVDVMTGIGAISGMGDGTFNPKGTITRAQAAKLVTYAVLGEATASRLSVATSSFTDVTAAGGFGWAIPSIEYLVKEGVINGMGDGTFNPNGEISSTATLKMLLCALGYGKKSEYIGQGWDFQVALDANKLGLTDGRTSTASIETPATREEVALYCFNTILKPTVTYVSSLDIYDTKGSLGSDNSSIAQSVYGYDDVTPANGILKVTSTASTTDAYGRPANVWTYKGETISTASKKPILTYTTGKTVAELKLAIANAGYKFANAATTVSVVTNNNGGTNQNIEAAHNTDVVGGNGTLMEVYADATSKEVSKIVLVETAIYKVTGVTKDNTATTNINESALTLTPVSSGTAITANDKTEGFGSVYSAAAALVDAGEDVYLTAVACGGSEHSTNYHALSVSIPQTATGKVSLVTKNTDGDVTGFVADGKTYQVGAKAVTAKTDAVAVDGEYTIIMDSNGYVLLVDTIKAANNFAVVVDAGTTTPVFGTAVVQMKLFTLTEGEKTVDTTEPANTFSKGNYVGHVVTYTPATGANTGKFVIDKAFGGTTGLTAVENGISSNPITDRTAIQIVGGKAEFKVATSSKAATAPATGYTANATTSVPANNETVFVLQIKGENGKADEYKTYTGVNSVPSVGGKNFCVVTKSGVAAVVYVADAKVTDGTTSGISFLAVDKTKEDTITGNITVYNAALIEGTSIKQVQVLKGIAPALGGALLKGYTANEAGIITAIDELSIGTTEGDAKAGGGYGVERASGEVIKLAGTSHTFTDDCVVWEIDASKPATNGRFTPKTIKQVATSETDGLFWVEHKDTGKVSALYVIKGDKIPVRVVITNDATDKAPELQVGDASTDWKTNTAPVLKATVRPGAAGFTATTYTWKYLDGTEWKALKGTPGSGATANQLTVANDAFTKAGTYKVKCEVTGTGNDKFADAVGEFTLVVKMEYAVPATAWASSAPTGWTKGTEAAGFTTDGKCTFIVKAGTGITAGDKLTVTITGGGDNEVIKYKAGTESEVTYTDAGITLTEKPGAEVTYTFTVSGITGAITAITLTVTPA